MRAFVADFNVGATSISFSRVWKRMGAESWVLVLLGPQMSSGTRVAVIGGRASCAIGWKSTGKTGLVSLVGVKHVPNFHRRIAQLGPQFLVSADVGIGEGELCNRVLRLVLTYCSIDITWQK